MAENVAAAAAENRSALETAPSHSRYRSNLEDRAEDLERLHGALAGASPADVAGTPISLDEVYRAISAAERELRAFEAASEASQAAYDAWRAERSDGAMADFKGASSACNAAEERCADAERVARYMRDAYLTQCAALAWGAICAASLPSCPSHHKRARAAVDAAANAALLGTGATAWCHDELGDNRHPVVTVEFSRDECPEIAHGSGGVTIYLSVDGDGAIDAGATRTGNLGRMTNGAATMTAAEARRMARRYRRTRGRLREMRDRYLKAAEAIYDEYRDFEGDYNDLYRTARLR
jgi:hypothetical protein